MSSKGLFQHLKTTLPSRLLLDMHGTSEDESNAQVLHLHKENGGASPVLVIMRGG
jgi:hypothetical protein